MRELVRLCNMPCRWNCQAAPKPPRQAALPPCQEYICGGYLHWSQASDQQGSQPSAWRAEACTAKRTVTQAALKLWWCCCA